MTGRRGRKQGNGEDGRIGKIYKGDREAWKEREKTKGQSRKQEGKEQYRKKLQKTDMGGR